MSVLQVAYRSGMGRDRRALTQRRVVAVALAAIALASAWLAREYGVRQAALLLLGVGCGVTLYHAAFGFTAAFRGFVTSGDGRGLRAQFLMLAVALTGFGLARMPNWERLWLGVMSIFVIAPSRTATLIGLALSLPTLWRQVSTWRAAPPASAAA